MSVQAAPVVLHKDIKNKIAEIRVKRDAIMLAHNKVNLEQDKYNKAIICLSLFWILTFYLYNYHIEMK